MHVRKKELAVSTAPQNSHLYRDPWQVWLRAMGLRGLSREAFESLQRTHFTYWYMSPQLASGPSRWGSTPSTRRR